MATKFGAVALLVSLAAAPVLGLENIDNVYWFVNPSHYYNNQTSSLVAFDADITTADLSKGLTYTIVELDENPLLSAPICINVLDGFTTLPSAGVRVHITTGFNFSCDPDGRLIPLGNTTFLDYCGETSVGEYVIGVGRGSLGSGFPVEEYEFAILDEHGKMAPTTTAENVFTPCVGSVVTAPEWTDEDVLEEIAWVRSQRVQVSRKPGDSGSIGIYFDPEGTICSGTIEPGIPQKIYVIAKTRGVTDCGIAGAEFRFTGVPDSWQISPVASPGVIPFGDPLADGTTLGMTCQQSDDGTLILYEVDVLASKLEMDVTFKLEPHVYPVGDFGCPLMILCDYPFFTQVCVQPIACHFNATSAKSCDGTVAVESKTWTHVKQLYR